MRRLSVLLLALLTAFAGAALTAGSAHAVVDPGITVTKDKPYYVAGQREIITGTITNAGSGSSVVVSVVLPDHATKNICISNVSDNDTYECGLTAYVNHEVHADLYNVSKSIVASATISVSEIASVTTVAHSGSLGFSGSYAVYAKGSSPAFRSYDSTGKVAPRCLRHEVQRRYASGWRRVFTSACRAEVNAHTDWRWLHKHTSKVKFRVRATFAGDAWNKPGHAAWLYFRFR
ncbi:MAG: hypothetical protein ACJ72E_13125 [Marmoricola sp.]